VEAEFAVHFQPQNQYCFAVDRDSPASFRDRVRLLARCFPDNVVLADREWPLDSAGHNMNRAHMDCLRQLSTPGHDHWRYVFLLQVYTSLCVFLFHHES
jgi:hypothetical protein